MAGLVESKKGGKFALITGGILLTADAFGLDLAFSPGFAIGVPYALVVVLGLWWPDRNYIITAAVVGSMLCLLGFYFSFLSGQLWVGAVNRGSAIFVIWMVAVLCLSHQKVKIKKLELQRLNEHIGQICSEEITGRDQYFLYKLILDSLLAFTQSRFGFIYGVMQDQEGKPFLEKKAGPVWNSLLEKPLPSTEEDVYNMAPLLDDVLHTGKPLLMKYVPTDLRKRPMSANYPPMESFMGLPFYHEGRLLGVVGVANRTGGYDESMMENMAPFLSACAIRIHAFKAGPEQLDMEEALKESRGKLQDMEKDTALWRLKILEKEAQLDQVEKTFKEQEGRLVAIAEGQGKGEEEFNRLQENLNRLQEEKEKTEERLRVKDAQIQKAEEDRNRTAGALWEKEQRLTDVLDDLNLLENDLKEKVESMDRMEEDLEQVQGQLHERDDRWEAMETRLDKSREELEEKERLVEWLEYKMLEVESHLQLAKNTLRYRERFLEKIEKQIHESFKGKREADSPKEIEQIALERKEKQKKQMEEDLPRQRQGLKKNKYRQVEPPVSGVDFESKEEIQNGKKPPLENELDDEKVKNRVRRYTRELERSNEDLREFASIASHDLQEPIRKIIGFGMRLKKDCSPYLDDRGKDYLERMERSAQQMQKFVDDLLQYSKVTISSTWPQRVDLKEVISHVLTVLETRIEQTHPIIKIGPMPVIEADRVQMAQLFQNLISNALKFHKKGEPPVVRISHRSREDGFHEIRVEDQGIGFDEKHVDRIFKPFERLHGRSEYEGTGMGLAICKKIVRRHGGELTAESSPQEGTTFIVTLPDPPLRGASVALDQK